MKGVVLTYALSCVAVLLFAGCGGSQSPINAPGATPLSRPMGQHPGRSKSPQNQSLLYASSVFGYVGVFTFPGLTPVATLNNLNSSAAGECTDLKGDVFITTYSKKRTGTIVEYAHGGERPIAALADPGQGYGCSVDPTTGNLAVSNVFDSSNSSYLPDIAIYKNAQGTPLLYSSTNMSSLYFCGYDNQGNLFVDGNDGNGNKALFELASGETQFSEITLPVTINSLGAVQWDGEAMTIADINNGEGQNLPEVIYKLSILNGEAQVVGTTTLRTTGDRHSGQTWIRDGKVAGVVNQSATGVAIWRYPKGDRPTTKSPHAGNDLFGVTISRAK